jgi:tripartite-type tricarboxylate transporter receptor subunit TctC
MLVGASAGSGADRIAREFANSFAQHMAAGASGVNEVDTVNRPGNAGRDMLAALGDAPATGAAIGWVISPTLAARVIDRDEPALEQRIQLLGQIEREPIAFVSLADDPADSVQDIIRRAGEDADAVPIATAQAGSPPHLAILRLQGMAQTRLNVVNFPSAAAARQALLSGTVSAAALGLSEVIDGVLDGTFSALGITAHRRFGLLPQTPILDEAGIPLKAFIRRGIAVPVGTPADIADAIIKGLRALADDADFRETAEKNGYYVTWADGPAWLQNIRAEQEILAKLWETDPWLASSGG